MAKSPFFFFFFKKSILKTLLVKEILLLWFILNQALIKSLSMSGNVFVLEGNG